MGKQNGGRIFYEAEFVKTPELIEFTLGIAPVPIPSQTGGQCSTDATIVALYYADGMRQALWSWFFKNAPGGKLNIPDEELNPELLRTDAQKLTTAFLLTIGARVLRILERLESRESVRPKSFSPSEETHGTTPSEVCSNLGISLARILKLRTPIAGAPMRAEIIDPGARTSGVDYSEGSRKKDQAILMNWISKTFLPPVTDPSVYGTFSVGKTGSLGVQKDQPIAIRSEVVEIESEENPHTPRTRSPGAHVFSVVRVNSNWYVADNEVGSLVPILTPEGGQLTPEIFWELETPHDVYFESRYTRVTVGVGSGQYIEAQYFLRNKEGEILALTAKRRGLQRDSGLLAVGPARTTIMRESYGVETPDGFRPIFVEPRTILYWRPPGRTTPPPTGDTSIMSMFRGPEAAGASGGKRKTRRPKSKRRKTSRAARVRPSLPK